MKKLVLMIATLVALTLTGCSPSQQAAESPGDSASLLEAFGLDGMTAAQIIDHLDRLSDAERPVDLMASVRTDELVLSAGQEEIALELPEDRYYLSVAPFIEQTHDCFYHSLTTCRGELPSAVVQLRATDSDGTVLVDQSATTYDNGFVGVWLPRALEGTIDVTYGDLRGQTAFSTAGDGPTCITTLQLA